MNCPKCPGKISSSSTKRGTTYGWCSLCKGIWVAPLDLQMIYGGLDAIGVLKKDRALRKEQTSFQCPQCDDFLVTARVSDSHFDVEECEKGHGFFFDEKELNKLLDILKSADLPEAPALAFNKHKIVKMNEKCPVCKNLCLYGVDNKDSHMKICLKCEGLLTRVEDLQKMATQSLFGPTMFSFRTERGQIAHCRACGEEQEFSNQSCRKCGRALVHVSCPDCNGMMAEYTLNGIVIERCQICNHVWLDRGEFEKVLTAMPDVRKRFEAGRRRHELKMTIAEATRITAELGFDITSRKMIDRFWGLAGIFFYP